MPYNLPPPWNPGFALPDNVVDEGLERRGFVTRQLPRGTYDNPQVGTGGYAVPQYVNDESYGRGTFTTKWQVGGSYNGPKVPNWLNQHPKVVADRGRPSGTQAVTITAMGDVAMPEPFETYGQRAATAMIGRVQTLPPGRRQQALKAMMDRVDKSLWGRTQGIAQRYVQQGMPVASAFPLALARAMSTGIAAEIIDTGMKRTPPPARSLLGLGCYGPSALGAAERTERGTKSGSGTRAAAGGGGGTDTRTAAQKAADLPSEIAVAQQTQADLASGKAYLDNGVVKYHVDQGFLDQVIGTVQNVVTSVVSTTAEGVAKVATTVGSGVSSVAQSFASGIASGAKVIYDVAGMPVKWTIDAAGAVYDAGGTLIGWVKDASGAIYDAAGDVIGWIKDAAVAVGHAVAEGIDDLGKLACALLQTPGVGAAAGAAAGTAAGVPPQAGMAAGQAGAQIAQGACGHPPPPPKPPVAATSAVPLILIGGAAVVGAFLIFGSGRRKSGGKP